MDWLSVIIFVVVVSMFTELLGAEVEPKWPLRLSVIIVCIVPIAGMIFG